MPTFPWVRLAIFVLAVAFVVTTAFYALTAAGKCPPEKPVLGEDGSCVPTSFFEATFEPRSEAGQK
jgi:hypothetical protein